MSSTRDENKQTVELPFGLERDLFEQMLSFANPNKSWHSREAIRTLANVSETCKSMHHFFTPALEKRLPMLALDWVLKGNLDIVKLATSHPEVFFKHATMHDNAVDLAGNRRSLKNWSAYQALFGTGNVNMLENVKFILDDYLKLIPDGYNFAITHIKEKFPKAFLYPGFRYSESTYNFTPLKQAITTDHQLRQHNKPSEATFAALDIFRVAFKPGTIETGHHFNMNDYIQALKMVDSLLNTWNTNQQLFFRVHVIGFLQRLLPAPYMQEVCKGKTLLDFDADACYLGVNAYFDTGHDKPVLANKPKNALDRLFSYPSRTTDELTRLCDNNGRKFSYFEPCQQDRRADEEYSRVISSYAGLS